MKPFCEIMVNDVFPTVRALIARELRKMGYTQVEIASKLSLTQPAISQYSREVRGKKAKIIEKNERALERIKLAARNIAKNPGFYAREMCGICRVLREERVICAFCKDVDNAVELCRECIEIKHDKHAGCG